MKAFLWTTYPVPACPKGQLISKCLLGVLNSFKTRLKVNPNCEQFAICQDHVCQDYVCYDPVCNNHGFLDHACKNHVCQDHVCHNNVCQDHEFQDNVCQDHVKKFSNWV